MNRQYLLAAHVFLIMYVLQSIPVHFRILMVVVLRCRHRVYSTPGTASAWWAGWFKLHQRFFGNSSRRNGAKYRLDCL